MSKVFDYAIPGQSLTKPPGAHPFERPPQFAEIGPALDYLWERMQSKEVLARMEVNLKGPITVMELAQTTLIAGAMEGKWSIDLAMLMLQTTSAMVEAIARKIGIKNYKFRREDADYRDFLNQYADMLEDKPTKETKKEQEIAKSIFFDGGE